MAPFFVDTPFAYRERDLVLHKIYLKAMLSEASVDDKRRSGAANAQPFTVPNVRPRSRYF